MNITFDFRKKTGKIKPMHAIGQPPRVWNWDTHMHYLTEAHIPFSRLHDVNYPFGGFQYVDIPNVFRDFDADENDPASYDFAFTDLLIKQLTDADCEPIYRLGVSIENFAKIKAYRIYPPADPEKWARICEHIVAHYNEGWADGFRYGIKYWEVWNEPDSDVFPGGDNLMFLGTPEEYYRLYEATSKRLKARFGDTIKVGGYASCGFYAIFGDPEKYGVDRSLRRGVSDRQKHFVRFYEDFLKFVKESGSPFDFFSWHSYDDVRHTTAVSEYVRRTLDEAGFVNTESHLYDWNNASEIENRGSSFAAAVAAAMMISMQKCPVDVLCYYDASISYLNYGGLFSPLDWKPLCAYYVFKAFGELYALGNEVECVCDSNPGEVFALGAAGDDGKRAVLIANSGADAEILTNLSGMKVLLIDKENFITETAENPEKFTIGRNQTVLIM